MSSGFETYFGRVDGSPRLPSVELDAILSARRGATDHLGDEAHLRRVAEYVHDQSRLNIDFLQGVADEMDRPGIDYEYTCRDTGMYTAEGLVTNLRAVFSRALGEGGENEEAVATELAGFRAASVWLKRSLVDVVEISKGTYRNVGYKVRAEGSSEELLWPHVVAGENRLIESGFVHLLLVPLCLNEGHSEWISNSQSRVGDRVYLHPQLAEPLAVAVTVDDFEGYRGGQIASLSAGANAEINDARSADSTDVSIHSASPGLIVFREGRRKRLFKKQEQGVLNFKKTEFPELLTPKVMEEFDVVACLERTMALMGNQDVFAELYRRFKRDSLTDPTSEMIQDAGLE